MKTVYITGDRSIDPINAVAIAGKAVAQVYAENDGEQVRFVTGTEGGVEEALRFVLADGSVTIVERPKTDEGYTDWDGFHKKLSLTVDSAVVLHGDPLGSRIGKSVTANFPDDKVRFLLQEQAEVAQGE